jgi:hypothetical protein
MLVLVKNTSGTEVVDNAAVLLICYGDKSICRESIRAKFSEIQG